MDIRCYSLADLEAAAWDALTSQASIFHTRQWAAVCENGLRSPAQALFHVGYVEGRPVIGCPIITTRKMGFSSAFSMPYGTYGGIIADDAISQKHKAQFLDHLVRLFNTANYSLLSLVNAPGEDEIDWPGYVRQEFVTHIIELPDAESFHPDDKKIEGHIRTGEKRGGEIIAVEGEAQLTDVIALYHMTEQRHGRRKPIMPENLFTSLFKEYSDDASLYWTAMLAENRLIGSMINLFYHDTMTNWQTVSDYSMREYKPNQLLLADAIEEAQRRNIRYINLGASPPEAAGLRDYKTRWGGREAVYTIYSKRSQLRKLIGR